MSTRVEGSRPSPFFCGWHPARKGRANLLSSGPRTALWPASRSSANTMMAKATRTKRRRQASWFGRRVPTPSALSRRALPSHQAAPSHHRRRNQHPSPRTLSLRNQAPCTFISSRSRPQHRLMAALRSSSDAWRSHLWRQGQLCKYHVPPWAATWVTTLPRVLNLYSPAIPYAE